MMDDIPKYFEVDDSSSRIGFKFTRLSFHVWRICLEGISVVMNSRLQQRVFLASFLSSLPSQNFVTTETIQILQVAHSSHPSYFQPKLSEKVLTTCGSLWRKYTLHSIETDHLVIVVVPTTESKFWLVPFSKQQNLLYFL
jgi:hypothetical protein